MRCIKIFILIFEFIYQKCLEITSVIGKVFQEPEWNGSLGRIS